MSRKVCIWGVQLPNGEWEPCGKPGVDYMRISPDSQLEFAFRAVLDGEKAWYCVEHWDRHKK
jgi:hypothetical protein